jgi:hypothetical protein
MTSLRGRLGWFAGLYLTSIAALALVTFVLRTILRLTV